MQHCPICLESVTDEDVKCSQCVALYHAECKPVDQCATCRFVYDVKKRNLNQIELINHYNETLIAEDMEPDEEEEEDEYDDDDDDSSYADFYPIDTVRPQYRRLTRSMVRRLLMQGYDYDYVFTVFPAQTLQVNLNQLFNLED